MAAMPPAELPSASRCGELIGARGAAGLGVHVRHLRSQLRCCEQHVTCPTIRSIGLVFRSFRFYSHLNRDERQAVMAVKPASAAEAATEPHASHTLKRGAIGLAGVVFMVVAFSAPITAMTGNLPVAVGFGNGLGAPGGFVIATVVLLVFSVGFVALARHITAA